MTTHWITTEAGAFVVPPCPAWCTMPPDHHLTRVAETGDDGAVLRVHVGSQIEVATLGRPIAVDVSACETVPAGDTPDDPATVMAGGQSFTAAQARRYAAALLDAAEVLDEITSSNG